MVRFKLNAKNYKDAESMAAAYLAAYFGNSEIEYPISPFKMLKDEGVDFVIRNFYKLEGIYIPAQSENDIDIFASALLMPMGELKVKVNEYKDDNGNVSFDDILKIHIFIMIAGWKG